MTLRDKFENDCIEDFQTHKISETVHCFFTEIIVTKDPTASS